MSTTVSLKNSNLAGDGGWEKIETKLGTGASGTIAFTNISPKYKDLEFVFAGRTTDAGVFATLAIFLNGSVTAADYAMQRFFGNGATAGAGENIGVNTYMFGGPIPGAGSGDANIHSTGTFKFYEANNTAIYKTMRGEINEYIGVASANLITDIIGGLFKSTSALTSISFGTTAGNWTTTTKITMYGRR